MDGLDKEIQTFMKDMEIAHDIIHGDDTTTVLTEAGVTPSLAKTLKDALVDPAGQLGSAVEAANSARDIAVASASSLAVVISETPPPTAVPGKDWVKSSTGKRYTWFSDGTSGQWVEAAGFYYIDDAVALSGAQQARTDAQTALALTNTARDLTYAARDAAVTAKNGSDAARIAAEAARDAANTSGKVFASTAGGIAGTTNGQTFSVLDSSLLYWIVYQNSSGVATELARSYTKAFFDKLFPRSFTAAATSLLAQKPNLFNKTTATAGFALNTITGATVANASWTVSDYIPVSGSTSYAQTGGQICYYDVNKAFISGTDGVSNFITPATAAFVRFSTTTSVNTYQLVQGGSVPSTYGDYGFTLQSTPQAPLTIVADSFSNAGTSEIVKAVNLSPLFSPLQGVVKAQHLSVFAQSANLFNKNTVTAGKSLDYAGTGGLLSSVGWNTSDFIRVEPSTAYIQTGGQVCYYDTLQNFISGATTVTTFTTPANAAFIRIATAGPLGTQQVAKGSTLPSPYVAFGYTLQSSVQEPLTVQADSLSAAGQSSVLQMVNSSALFAPVSAAIKPRNLSFLSQSVNLFNKATVTANKSLDYSGTGGLLTSANWNASDYIRVDPNTTYTRTDGQICYYDINLTFISGSSGTATVTTPANAAYIRVASAAPLATYMVVLGSVVPSRFVPYGFTANPNEPVALDTPWAGKNWGVLGDSITFGDVYQNMVVSKTGLVVTFNNGVAGRAVRDMDDDLTASNIANLDLITIFGGTNDYGGNRTLGTLADATDSSVAATFYNDVYQVLKNIYTLKPSVRVMFFTPLIRGAYSTQVVYPAANSVGATLKQYVTAIKEVCELFGTPVCDLFATSGINLLNLATFTSDNLHPNTAGHTLISRKMAAFINTN